MDDVPHQPPILNQVDVSYDLCWRRLDSKEGAFHSAKVRHNLVRQGLSVRVNYFQRVGGARQSETRSNHIRSWAIDGVKDNQRKRRRLPLICWPLSTARIAAQ